MGNWSNKRLGDIIQDIKDGGTPNRSISEYFGGEIPWVVIDDIKDEIHQTKENLTELGLKKCSSILWDEGDLILSTGATIGIVGITKIRTATKQGICGIRTKPELIDNNFLKYWFQLNRWQLLNNAQGSTIKEIRPSTIAKLKLDIPDSLPEQTRIAEILSTADEAIAHTEALIAKYQRIKTGLMHDLLTKGIDENGNIRSEAAHQFKDSPLGRIPKEWDCDKLISFCQKIQDGTHFSPKTDANGTHKYITSKNIRMGYLDLSNLEFIDEVSHNKIYKRCSVEFGDVLLTKDGASTGNICLNNLNEEFSLLSSVALIRGKRGVLKNEFIFQFFMETKGQMSLVEQMSGNAITRITLTKINNTLIKVPSFPEQELIIQRLKSLDELVNDEKTKLSKLQSLKTGLMQDLLSGKVRVKIQNR